MMRRILLAGVLVMAAAACGDDGGDGGNGATDAAPATDAAAGADASNLCAAVTCDQGTCNDGTGDCDCNAGWEGVTCDTVITPPMNNLLFWLDGNDTNGNGTKPALGPLDVWVDKSGNVSNFTQSGDQRPSLVDGPNGLTMVSFDGTDDFMPGGVLSGITNKFAYTVVIVARGGDNDNAFLAGTETVGDNPGLLIETETGGNARFLHRQPFGATVADDLVTNNAALSASALNRIWITRDAQATPDIDIFLNDALGSSNVGAAADFSENMNLAIGRENIATDSRYLTGEIAEVLIYLGVVSPNNTPELATYLQAKWGVN